MTPPAPAFPDARVADDTAQWSVWSTTARVVVTDPAALEDAYRLVTAHLDEVDAAASRFRDDAEIMNLHAGRNEISPLLADLVGVALDAARLTDGLVDPTLGNAMRALGYDRDFAQVRAGAGTGGRVVVTRRATWRDITLDGTTLTLPDGLALDLGATAKAATADLAAADVADRLGIGVLVSLGGDIATAGPGPDGGWRILVSDGDDEPESAITLPAGSAVATSSTIRRVWTQDGRAVHHILDPLTLRPAEPVWRTVTVAAPNCALANTLSTAAIIKGTAARGWLEQYRSPARLVDAHGALVRVSGWPEG